MLVTLLRKGMEYIANNAITINSEDRRALFMLTPVDLGFEAAHLPPQVERLGSKPEIIQNELCCLYISVKTSALT